MEATATAAPASGQATSGQEGKPATTETTKAVPNLPNQAQAEGNTVKEAVAEAKRKMKIDDAEVDEDEVVNTYKKRKEHQQAANKKLQEALKLQREAKQFIESMKDKRALREALVKLGHDPRKLAEETLSEVLEEEMLDPKEREYRQTKAENERYKRELEERQAREAKEKKDSLKAHFAKQYTEQFTGALEKSGLPKTKDMVASMAKYIARSAKIGFEMTADEAATLVKQDLENSQKSILSASSAEMIAKVLGEDGLKKIREYEAAKLKDPSAKLVTPEDQNEVTRRTDSGRRLTAQEWREYNRR